jgi:hypothetical protein
MRSTCLFVALACLAGTASAQPIHDHPRKSAYASPAEWPWLSAQCHWADPILPMLAHTHMDVQVPLYAVVNQPITVPFTVWFFHTQGRGLFIYGELIRDVVWDATSSSAQPSLEGVPMGLVSFTGHLTIDPNVGDGSDVGPRGVPAHGWWMGRIAVRTRYASGVVTDTSIVPSFYALRDPQAPEVLPSASIGVYLAAGCNVASPLDPNGNGPFNTLQTEYHNYLPILAPLTSPTPIEAFVYSYGADPRLPPGVAELRADMDLHNGDSGRLLPGTRDLAASTIRTVLDPATLGAGTHKIAAIWAQETGAGVPGAFIAGEQAAALLVVSVTVGDGPGVPPPPPPDPTWQQVLPTFWQLNNQLKVCTADGQCVALGSVQ